MSEFQPLSPPPERSLQHLGVVDLPDLDRPAAGRLPTPA